MALIQMNMISKSLMRSVNVTAIIPCDKIYFPGMPEREDKPFKTLYLLHGILGSQFDWLSGTCIQRWAEEKNLAVIMPAGENMFYIDQEKPHTYYGEFIGQELVELTRKLFPLSRKREDTYIAGLSMGGYGALRNGLKYHDTFGCIAALSAANIVENINSRTDDTPIFMESRSYAESVFGDLSKVNESDKDIFWSAKKVSAENAALPKVYIACGLSDMLLEKSRNLRDGLGELGFDVTYEEGEGSHEWDFWNRQIKKVLEWLPLEDNGMGMNSGNIS